MAAPAARAAAGESAAAADGETGGRKEREREKEIF